LANRFLALRFVYGFETSGVGAFCSDSAVVFISFSPDRVAVVTRHHSGWEKHQGNSSTITLTRVLSQGSSQSGASFPLFMDPTKMLWKCWARVRRSLITAI